MTQEPTEQALNTGRQAVGSTCSPLNGARKMIVGFRAILFAFF